jgi:hypothetical protein
MFYCQLMVSSVCESSVSISSYNARVSKYFVVYSYFSGITGLLRPFYCQFNLNLSFPITTILIYDVIWVRFFETAVHNDGCHEKKKRPPIVKRDEIWLLEIQ